MIVVVVTAMVMAAVVVAVFAAVRFSLSIDAWPSANRSTFDASRWSNQLLTGCWNCLVGKPKRRKTNDVQMLSTAIRSRKNSTSFHVKTTHFPPVYRFIRCEQ